MKGIVNLPAASRPHPPRLPGAPRRKAEAEFVGAIRAQLSPASVLAARAYAQSRKVNAPAGRRILDRVA